VFERQTELAVFWCLFFSYIITFTKLAYTSHLCFGTVQWNSGKASSQQKSAHVIVTSFLGDLVTLMSDLQVIFSYAVHKNAATST